MKEIEIIDRNLAVEAVAELKAKVPEGWATRSTLCMKAAQHIRRADKFKALYNDLPAPEKLQPHGIVLKAKIEAETAQYEHYFDAMFEPFNSVA